MANNVKQIYVAYYITWNVTNMYVKIWQWIEWKNEIDGFFLQRAQKIMTKNFISLIRRIIYISTPLVSCKIR